MSARLTLQEAAAFLLAHDDYLLLSHRRPDGDTTGSCAALCRALRALGKRAWVYPNPQFTPRFAPFLEGLLAQTQGSGIKDQESGNYTILSCDIASRSLFPFGMEDAEVALAVDHHGTNDGFAVRSLVDGNAAACGELLTQLIPAFGVAGAEHQHPGSHGRPDPSDRRVRYARPYVLRHHPEAAGRGGLH